MKKLLTTSVLVIGTVCSAYAADMRMPAYKSPAPVAPPPPSWTGCYVDGGGGYGLWNIDHNFQGNANIGGLTSSQSTSGGRGAFGIVGGGCDYQFTNAWVVGLFADYEFMNLHRNLEELGTAGNEKEKSAWGVGGRVGYLVTPNVYTYFDGGYTQTRFDQVNFSLNFTPFTPFSSIPGHTYNGWFLGGGTEISLSGFFGLPLPPGLFLRNEYRFSTYNSAALPVTLAGAPGTVIGNENLKPYVQTIWTALVYRFNWTGH